MPDGFLQDPRVLSHRGVLRDAGALLGAGLIAPGQRDAVAAVEARYAVAIPPALQALIDTPGDPMGLQFIPHPDELLTAAHERADPIGDDALSPLPGIVHRYPDRVLLKPLLVCPTYCRFCFRREHVGPDGGLLTEAELDAALGYIAGRPELREVILTGGDPLMLSPRRLAHIVGRLSAMPQIEIIRLHSRVPVAMPELVTPDVVAALATDKAMFLVLHANHARELTDTCGAALRLVQQAGISVLSQSVLLRGVNDDAGVLEALLRRLLRLRVKPYYLHQLDAAPGTARFHVPIEQGRVLLDQLRGRVSGLAWPTYVFDIPGGHGKVPIGPDHFAGPGLVRGLDGALHASEGS